MLALLLPRRLATGAEELSIKVFKLNYRRVEEAALLIRPHLSDSASVTLTQRLNAMTVTDREENLKTVAKLLADFDVPPRGFTFAIKLVRARADVPAGSIAQEIGGLGAKLKSLFQFNDYALIDSAVLRGVEGRRVECRLGDGATCCRSRSGRRASGDDLLLSPFTLLAGARGTSIGRSIITPIYRAPMPITLNQTLVVGASREEQSKSALILILLAQELPRAEVEKGVAGSTHRGEAPVSPQFSVKIGWPDGSIAEEAIEARDTGLARSEVERRGGHVFEVRRKGLSLSGPRGGRRGPRQDVGVPDLQPGNDRAAQGRAAGRPLLRDPARAAGEPGAAPRARRRPRADQRRAPRSPRPSPSRGISSRGSTGRR